MMTVTLDLPEALVQRAGQAARVMHRPVEEVLAVLLEGALPALDDVPAQMQTELVEMTWLNDRDLTAIMDLAMSEAEQARLAELGVRGNGLSPEEDGELQTLRDRYGELTLRKARAFALLSVRSGKRLLNDA
jgi:hypothetical protein